MSSLIIYNILKVGFMFWFIKLKETINSGCYKLGKNDCSWSWASLHGGNRCNQFQYALWLWRMFHYTRLFLLKLQLNNLIELPLPPQPRLWRGTNTLHELQLNNLIEPPLQPQPRLWCGTNTLLKPKPKIITIVHCISSIVNSCYRVILLSEIVAQNCKLISHVRNSCWHDNHKKGHWKA